MKLRVTEKLHWTILNNFTQMYIKMDSSIWNGEENAKVLVQEEKHGDIALLKKKGMCKIFRRNEK